MKKIVFPTDFSEVATNAFRYALELAKQYHAEIILLHTYELPIADGDVIRNQYDKNYQPLELGYDKWTGKMYANKEFLLNCVNYLLDDSGLINIRNKEVKLALLDTEKVKENYTFTQVVPGVSPLVILGIFGLFFTLLRKRRYAR